MTLPRIDIEALGGFARTIKFRRQNPDGTYATLAEPLNFGIDDVVAEAVIASEEINGVTASTATFTVEGADNDALLTGNGRAADYSGYIVDGSGPVLKVRYKVRQGPDPDAFPGASSSGDGVTTLAILNNESVVVLGSQGAPGVAGLFEPYKELISTDIQSAIEELYDLTITSAGIWIDADRNLVSSNHNAAFQAAVNLQDEFRQDGKIIPIMLRGQEFYLTASTELPDGALPVIIGPGWQMCRVNIGNNVNGLINRREFDTGGRSSGARFYGVHWDGGNERSGDWPYTHTRTGGRAFTIRCRRDIDAFVEIENCRFSRFNDLPYWVDSARGKFLHDKSDLVETKDPGILRCRNGLISNSFAYFSADNAWSVSRSNRDFSIVNCGAFGCHQGLFLGGTNRQQNGSTAKLSGASYVAGAPLTLTIEGSPPLYIEQEGGNVTLVTEDGTATAVVKVVEVLSGDDDTEVYTASCVALGAVPAGLQNTETPDWFDGPSSGASNVTVTGWQSRFTGLNSIFVNQGCDGVVITGFSIIAPGYDLSSPSRQKGNSVPGFTSRLLVEDASLFTEGEWVAVDPFGPDEKHFLSPISDINLGTNTLTLQVPLPRIIVNADVYACQQTLSTGGMALVGDWETSFQFNWVQDTLIQGGVIIDPCNFGIRLGSSAGSARDSAIKDVIIRYRNTVACVIGSSGVLLSSRPENMRAIGLEVSGCTIAMPTGVSLSTRGVRYQPQDTSDAGLLRANNTITADTPYLVEELATGTNITSRQNVINQISRNLPDLMIGKYFATPNAEVATFTLNTVLNDGTYVINFPASACIITSASDYVISDFTTLDSNGNDWTSQTRTGRVFIRKATDGDVGLVSFLRNDFIRTYNNQTSIDRTGWMGLNIDIFYSNVETRNILQIYG